MHLGTLPDAAIIHDLLYKRIRQYRAKEGDLTENINAEEIINNYKAAKKEADKVFLAAMKDADPSVPKWKIYSAYSVVLFGRLVNHTERGRLMLDYFYAFCERYGSKISCLSVAQEME